MPVSVFRRAAEELWLRGQGGWLGGRFGSRMALNGRVYCPCGQRMRRLRRLEPVFVCDACGSVVPEAELKRQVLVAVDALPGRADHIRACIEENRPLLDSTDRMIRAEALRRDWRLKNLLPAAGVMGYSPDCRDEDDFRERTRRRVDGWNDDALARLLDRVVAGAWVRFKGDVEV